MRFVHAIAAVTAVLISGSAAAVNLSPLGTGQVLLYPYYTVNANQDTYFAVANQSSAPQVIKVRFLEGRNGRPALDVDVVLKGHDEWTAAISVDAGGGAKLVTQDDSCTRPAIPASGIVFTSSGYDGSSTIPADNGPHDISRVREGSIEVIGGAAILSSSSGEVSIDCGTIFDQLGTADLDLVAPAKLFGWAAIIDVAAGHYYNYVATAIDEFTAVSLYSSDWGPLKPTLNAANGAEDDTHHAVAHFFVQGKSPQPSYGVPQRGEYGAGVGLGANTDWVITMPTKRFYLDPLYPDTNRPEAGVGFSWLGCCSAFTYDRTGTLQSGPVNFSLAYTTNVISFLRTPGSSSGVFSSALAVNVVPSADTGTMRLDLPFDHSFPGLGDSAGFVFDGGQLYGAPIIGFMAYNIVNANAQPGLLANYGAVAEHRRTTCASGGVLNSFVCQW